MLAFQDVAEELVKFVPAVGVACGTDRPYAAEQNRILNFDQNYIS